MGDSNKTIAIIGTGTSLNELPRDFVFPDGVDTMTLNTAAIAPQFYDIKTETWREKGWTYCMFLDADFAKHFIFPECHAYHAAMARHDGIKYITDRLMSRGHNFTNVQRVHANPGGSVLCPALNKAHELGYRRIVLVGCDYCRRKDENGNYRTYWWETDPDYLTHPRNNTLIPAGSDAYKLESNGKVTISLRKAPGNWRQIDMITAPNGEEVLAENLYKEQMGFSNAIMDKLMGEGVAIFKYKDFGLLSVPSLDSLDKLEI